MQNKKNETGGTMGIAGIATAALNAVGAGLGFVGNIFDRRESRRQHDKALQVDERNYQSGEFWNQQNFDEQRRQYEQNFAMQQEQQQWDRAIQQQIFDREDNAIQRRVDDMRAAGINPVLAAGNAANAGGIVSSTAPQTEIAQRQHTPHEGSGTHISRAQQKMQEGIARNAAIMELFGNVTGPMLDVLQRQASIEMTEEQANLIRVQANDMPGAAADRRIQATAAMENANHAGRQANAAMANAMTNADRQELEELNSMFDRMEQSERINAMRNENFLRNNTLYRELEMMMKRFGIEEHDMDRTIALGLRTMDQMTEEQKYLSQPMNERARARTSRLIDTGIDIGTRLIENIIDTVTGQSSGRQDMRRNQRSRR